MVQGYKFNILYHDLIDKQVAPSYKVERDPESADDSTCMLRFTAGPPYEDIAFRWAGGTHGDINGGVSHKGDGCRSASDSCALSATLCIAREAPEPVV